MNVFRATAFAVVMGSAWSTVQASDYCPNYEYAELQDMTLEELGDLRFQISLKSIQAAGDRHASPADSSACDTQATRLDRLIRKRRVSMGLPAEVERPAPTQKPAPTLQPRRAPPL